jgi:hypothetical protein
MSAGAIMSACNADNVAPGACMWCDRERRAHSIEWANAVGYHTWIAPTMKQRKQRMLARRAPQ